MNARQIFFWTHLIAGSLAGLVILMMCVTGVLLTYERQMIDWSDREFRVSAPPGTARLTPESVVTVIQKAGERTPASLVVRSDPSAPAEASYGREKTLFVNPYTGAVLGTPKKETRDFFHSLTEWHRWFAASGESRGTARAVTGACNLAFFYLALTGLYLWLPRKWTWQHIRPIFLFRAGLSGKARDFNWHNVIGLWSAVPLLFITASGAVMSYPWANNLLYQITGTPVPAPQGPRGPGGPAGGPAGGPGRGGPGRPDAPTSVDGFDRAFLAATQAVPEWRTITLRLAESRRGPLNVGVDTSTHRGRPDLASTLTIDRSTGSVIRRDGFADLNAGRRLRSWMRFIHTGEPGGFVGQTIAGLASLGGAVLVYTGIVLALRRFLAWRSRKSAARKEQPAYQI